MLQMLSMRSLRSALLRRQLSGTPAAGDKLGSSLKRRRPVDSPVLRAGSLCYDHVFRRIMGTESQSEVILVDLLSAWRMAFTGSSDIKLNPFFYTGPASGPKNFLCVGFW